MRLKREFEYAQTLWARIRRAVDSAKKSATRITVEGIKQIPMKLAMSVLDKPELVAALAYGMAEISTSPRLSANEIGLDWSEAHEWLLPHVLRGLIAIKFRTHTNVRKYSGI